MICNSVSKLPLVHKIIKTNIDFFTLIAFGDIHLGHEDCDEKAASDMVKWIAEKDPSECAVILTGDLIENVLPTTKGSLFEMKYPSPDKQVDMITEMLQPISEHVILMTDGNHEDRTQRTSGISVSKVIAKNINVKYVGYHGMTKLTLQRGKKTPQSYLIYTEHGCGSIPRNVGGRYNKMESIQKQVEADVYIKGHIHQKSIFSKRIWKNINGKMEKRKVMFAANGSYLQDAEYAIRSGFEPTDPGVAKIFLNTERFNIHGSV